MIHSMREALRIRLNLPHRTQTLTISSQVKCDCTIYFFSNIAVPLRSMSHHAHHAEPTGVWTDSNGIRRYPIKPASSSAKMAMFGLIAGML